MLSSSDVIALSCGVISITLAVATIWVTKAARLETHRDLERLHGGNIHGGRAVKRTMEADMMIEELQLRRLWMRNGDGP
ncbi:hypothetical protein B0O99DRAFT_638118 [Bisporella sp. PMI_857]|nr:hypothetical protein B0O99DRAFT_638118 [Bisporella sp. PMI_857]